MNDIKKYLITSRVIIEQPPSEKFRIKFDSETGSFSRTNVLSYYYQKKFPWWYGWVDGMGTPPGFHCDAMLISEKNWNLGDIVSGYLIGLFTKKFDYKYLIIEIDKANSEKIYDLYDLPSFILRELYNLYPFPLDNEKWYGRKFAEKIFLKQKASLKKIKLITNA